MKFPRPEDINSNLWYCTSQAAYLLGIDRKTVANRAAMGAMCGGLDYRINKANGRKEFKGEELLRYLYGINPQTFRDKKRNSSIR